MKLSPSASIIFPLWDTASAASTTAFPSLYTDSFIFLGNTGTGASTECCEIRVFLSLLLTVVSASKLLPSSLARPPSCFLLYAMPDRHLPG